MRIPDAVELLILVLGAGRLLRLAGWDEFPLAKRIRAWAIGEEWVPVSPVLDEATAEPGQAWEHNRRLAAIGENVRKETGEDFGLPGKQPSSEVDAVRPAYRRPTLAHLVHCPFCMGWWISLAVAVAWFAAPTWTLYVLLPLALSNAVGLIAKNLDA